MGESYTYSSKQFRVIIKKINDLYTFSVINEDTNELFQSEETELKRISQQTLTAAFNDKVKNITYEVIYEDQNYIKITIRVSLDFLPQFCQNILLKKVQKDQTQFQKLHYFQLKNQIQVVGEELQWLVDTSTSKKIFILQKQMQNINGTENIIKINVEKGNYLVQYWAVGANGGLYQKQYFSQDDYSNNDGYYGSIPNFNTKSNLLFKVNLNKDCVYSINCKPFDYYSNYDYPEYPISFNFIIQVEQKSQMSVSVKDYNNINGILNSNKLILQKINIQKQ